MCILNLREMLLADKLMNLCRMVIDKELRLAFNDQEKN